MNIIIGDLNSIFIRIHCVRKDYGMLYIDDRNNGGVENFTLIIPDGHFHIFYLIWYKDGYHACCVINRRE